MSRGAGTRAPHQLGPSPRAARATIDVDSAGDTPILREYRAVKAQYPDCVVLARLGDFYEMFGADAETAAPLLGLTLTGRNFGNAGRVPMCGVPQQSVTQHVGRLIAAGHRVALWDQVGEPGGGRLVERRVTRVLSAGTAVDPGLLDAAAVARCVAVLERKGSVGIAVLDASTGSVDLIERRVGLDAATLADDLLRFDAAELLHPEDTVLPPALLPGVPRTPLAPSLFDLARADQRILAASATSTLGPLDVDDVPLARSAAGAALAYAERCGVHIGGPLLTVGVVRDGAVMRLDAQTRRALELLQPMAGTGPSVMSVLDRTHTAMGSRLLRAWVQTPLAEVERITERADAVSELVTGAPTRDALGIALQPVRDLERLVARCAQGSAGARDLAAVRDACAALDEVRAAMGDVGAGLLRQLADTCVAPAAVTQHLAELLVETPPLEDGGAVLPGADAELDALLAAADGARSYIATLEQRERERSGIRSLRVGYNRVFGYYIEVPHAQSGAVPAEYVRKQTLAGAERYITPDLREQEAIVLHARDRALQRERELLREAAALVAVHAATLMQTAHALAALDVLRSLAEVAVREHWTRAVVDRSEVLDIEAGRHPLVERSLGPGGFVPNDTALDAAARVLLLTGPNMAGKSTYLRQVAVITLLAHIGSHVPAERARIGVCDRIFTRVGAHDDLSGGMSTFMVEMAETALILRHATARSLVILDEIGRGTSTYDGLCIAQATVEHIHDAPQLNCRTLFATHYHELTRLEDSLPRLRNARVEVVEEGGGVVFRHRIVPGGADRSYGIHVARLAGVPVSVLLRASALLDALERRDPSGEIVDEASQLQLALNPSPAHPVVAEIAELDIDTMSPLHALNKLAELRRRVAE